MKISQSLGRLISGLLTPRASASPAGRSLLQQPQQRQAQAFGPPSTTSVSGQDRVSLSETAFAMARQACQHHQLGTSDADRQQQHGGLPALPLLPEENPVISPIVASETPATRQQVRRAYGTATGSAHPAASNTSGRIDFRA